MRRCLINFLCRSLSLNVQLKLLPYNRPWVVPSISFAVASTWCSSTFRNCHQRWFFLPPSVKRSCSIFIKPLLSTPIVSVFIRVVGLPPEFSTTPSECVLPIKNFKDLTLNFLFQNPQASYLHSLKCKIKYLLKEGIVKCAYRKYFTITIF